MMPARIDNISFNSIQDLAREYRMTAAFAPDGKAMVTWRQGDSNP